MRYSDNDKRTVMRSKEEVALAYIVILLVVIPVVALFPEVLGLGLIGYCLYILYSHYTYKG